MKVIYTGTVHIDGGRNGTIRSDDGKLEAKLAFPKALGGDGEGTNPEQLFGAGYAACFTSTLAHLAKSDGIELARVRVTAEVDMLHDAGTYDLAVRLLVAAEGPDRTTLEGLIERAKTACPYSRATRTTLATSIRLA